MAGTETDEKAMTVGEWVNAAGFLLLVYLLVGLFWADSRGADFDAYGIDKPVTYGLHVVLWPVLVFLDLDLDVLGMHLHLT